MLSLIMYYKQTGGARSRMASWTVATMLTECLFLVLRTNATAKTTATTVAAT